MSRFRVSGADLARFLDSGATPVYVLDEDRRIVFCNAACADWVGVAAAQLVGQQCNYHPPGIQPESDRVATDQTSAKHAASDPIVPEFAEAAIGLCPPPQAFSGKFQRALVSCVQNDGQLVYRRGVFVPLTDGGDESAPVIAILELADCLADAPLDPTRDEQLHEHVRRFQHEAAGRFAISSLLGKNPLVQRARAQIELAAKTRANTLIVGPAGAGKDRAAKAIHYAQSQPGTLVPLACARLETNLLRSMLRALASRGSAAKPACSTLILGEVDSISPEAQGDLADLLRSGVLSLMIISTSTRPLEVAVSTGHLSRELACALSTLVIELPSLSNRVEDLPLLAQTQLEAINALGGRQVGAFTAEAIDQLAAYTWPGNLDELAAVVREAHEHSQGGEITIRDLPKKIQWGADAVGHASRSDESLVLEEFLPEVERELISRAMRRAKGNKSRAARLLGLTRPRLYRRLVQLGLEPPAEPGSDGSK